MNTVGELDSISAYGKPSDGWPINHCKYCAFRPRAPAGTDESKMWYYGTGDGQHDALHCAAFRRFITEGGFASKYPEQAKCITSCLRFGKAYTEKHRPKQN
jgi:hypothetical protein